MKRLFAAIVGAALVTVGVDGRARADEDDHRAPCKKLPANADVTIDIKRGSSLADLAAWASSFTCKTIVFTDGAAAEGITLVAPRPMRPARAWELFVSTVGLYDLVVVEKGDLVTVREKPGSHRCNNVTGAATPPAPPSLDPELATGIQLVDPLHVTITAAAGKKLAANTVELSGTARFVPAIRDGKPDGIKVYAIRPDSICARLGLQNGDTLQSLNGKPLDTLNTTEDFLAAARAALRGAHGESIMRLGILRRGEPLVIEVTLLP